MCSSRPVEGEPGVFEVTTPGCYEVGHRLYLHGAYTGRSPAAQAFEGYLARLALSRSGRAWNEGVRVLPPDGALAEEIANGCIHPSLIAEPNGERNGRIVGVDGEAARDQPAVEAGDRAATLLLGGTSGKSRAPDRLIPRALQSIR